MSVFGRCQLGDGIVSNGRRQECPRPSAARIAHAHGGTTTLCHEHLDGWLDNADADPSIEPAGMELLGAGPAA